MKKTLLKNARMVNEGRVVEGDLLIEGDRIGRIGTDLSEPHARTIDLEGA
jgi:dihydroorotase